MAFVIEVPNSFEPTNHIKHKCEAGVTVRGWLENQYPGFVEFPVPTICIFNGKPLLRAEWEKEIKEGDVVGFVAVPSGPFLLIAIVIIAVLVVVTLSLTTALPHTPGAGPASDPVFSLKGQSNEVRLGEPIEVCYGRNRLYPSLAARPYFQYIDNDQFEYALLCLGQGYYEIEQIQIGDTPIENYQEVEYQLINPGEPITLFPTNVITSIEAGGQTLLAPNEEEYTAPGWVGPFATNASSTLIKQIQVDVIFPKGLYLLDNDGGVQELTVQLQIQAQTINNAGVPIGAWIDLPDPTPLEISAATTTPQRRTLMYDVTPAARYHVRIRRVDSKDLTTRSGHDVVWEGLRGYLDQDVSFSGLTLLAIKIRATNNLNDKSNLQFNVICTRKLLVRGSEDGAEVLMPTRSIVWAFVDVFKSEYGGRLPDDSFLDWARLEELDALYASRGDNFDWIFRDPIAVWEAARTIGRAGRATPLLIGSLITLKRDGPQEIPVTLFTPDVMTAGSFNLSVKLWDVDEFDSCRIEYTEPATGYKQETVLCSLPGDTNDNPEDIRLPGVQDRTQAYHEGLFILAQRRYQRENLVFDTGMEGHLPTFGDLIAVAHDMPRWGQSGFIVNAEQESDGRHRLWLSEPMQWEESGDYQIVLRAKNSAFTGPFNAIRTTSDSQILIEIRESSGEFDFLLSGKTEPMIFLFGLAGSITKYAKVVKVEPQGGEAVRITAVNDAPVIHSFDELVPPALGESPFPIKAPDLPTISHLYLNQIDSSNLIIQASWTAAYGAKYYIVQTSTDGINWTDVSTTIQTSIQLQVPPGTIWVRVAGVNNGQGPWIQDTIYIGLLVLTLAEPWVDLEWAVSWSGIFGADGYEVRVYDTTESSPVLKHTETLAVSIHDFLYDYSLALADSNLTRNMEVQVSPIFSGIPSGHAGILDLFNSVPLPPTDLGSETAGLASDGINYRLFWTVPHENDLIRIKVWLSLTPDFDPNSELPIVDETISSPGWADIPTEVFITIPFDSSGDQPAQFWRVALFDVWGNEILTNISDQQSILSLSGEYNRQAALVALGLPDPDYAIIADLDAALYEIFMGTASSGDHLTGDATDEALGLIMAEVIYNDEGMLVVMDTTAPDYYFVAEIDSALYSISQGTATAEEIALGAPVDDYLGSLL